MSITEFRAAKRDDRAAEREQDRADRLAAEQAKLERDRLAAEQKLERERLAQEAEDKRREQDRADRQAAEQAQREREEADRKARAQAEKERKREADRKRRERRERRAAFIKSVPGWVSEHLDLAAALAVMACSIVPALISQAGSLSSTGIAGEDAMGWMGGLLIALLPVMLECSAWAATAGEAKAMKQRRSPWPYRVAIYSFAGMAAWVNYLHGDHVGGEEYGLLLGSVLAASSVIPIAVWQLVQVGRHGEYKAQRKADREAKSELKAWRERCKKLYPDVWHTAKQLRAIAGPGELTELAAWQAAYAVHEGAGDGEMDPELMALLSADLLELRVDAEGRLADVLNRLRAVRTDRLKASATLTGKPFAGTGETSADASVKVAANGGTTPPTRSPETSVSGLLDHLGRPLTQSASSQAAPSVPPSARARETAPARTRKPRPAPPVRTLSKGAKNAAKETAKRSATAAAADEKKALEEWALTRLRTSGEVTWQEIRDEAHARRKTTDKKAVAPGRSWAYDRRTAALEAHGKGGLHAVRTGEAA
ncbi:hypothetical protein E4198_00080 [Streptomyces sp. RKND-216]|uniref:MAP7 domain-containing protein n=1 Tax=Streptomyces sp. RKND-216 TaxID=2562581 RepID=UPI00109D8E90|nr:MAP7 domain-containing protein [Streptomyces sp. RKND-216]THA28248.1 hypothetical protein E4198_00080 [Streptomyces sp. RKND-216]